MGVAERKAREKESLKARILEAARNLVVKEGFDKVSIRKIAKAIEYSPGTIYLYYKNKDELFYDLHEQSFKVLLQHLMPTQDEQDPVQRILKMGEQYIDFAVSYPNDYELMFLDESPLKTEEAEAEWNCAHDVFQCLIDTLQYALDKEVIAPQPIELLALNTWAHVHGLISLYLRNRFKMFPGLDHIAMLHQASRAYVELMLCARAPSSAG